MSISNVMINNFLNSRDENFIGVFSSNELCNIDLKNNKSLIVNLSSVNEPGTHFIAFHRKNKKLLMFDSLASYIVTPTIKRFIIKQNLKIIYSHNKVQHDLSQYCGYFCIAFTLLIKHMSLNSFINLFFHNNLILNDYIVLQLVKMFI